MTDNTQARSGGTSIPTTTGAIGTDILKNILDEYENPTYHFRLYIVSPTVIRDRGNQFGNQNERIVIAESGVSPVDIDNVEITTTGSITKEAGTGLATSINFTLREPYGVELLDNIQRASLALGIENFQKVPFFLELSFKGRRSSDLGGGGPDNPLSTLVWTWAIQLKSMAMNVNTGGATYAIESQAYGDMAYTNQASDTEQPIKIDAATVKELFSDLQAQLTKREADKVESANYTLTDTYTFWIDDEISNASIVPSTKEERESRGASYSDATGKMQFQFTPGESIEMIVRKILSLTSLFQKDMKSTTDVDAAGEAGGGENAIYSKLWRVVADTEIGDYDYNRRDYQRHYKYLIIPYEMTSNLTPSNILSNMPSKDRYLSHKKRGIIRKKYDYLYSGRNDQVFDFDLNFNFNWFINLPIRGGLTTQIRNAEAAAKQTLAQQESTADQLKKLDGWQQKYTDTQNALDGLPSGALPGFDPIAQLIEMLKNQVQGGSIGSFDTSAVEGYMGDIENAQTQATDAVQGGIGGALGAAQDGVLVLNETLPGVVSDQMSPIIDQAPTLAGELGLTAKADRTLPHSPVDPSKSAQVQLRSIDFQLDDVGTAEHEFMIAITMQEAKTKSTLGEGQAYAETAGQTLLSAMFEQAESPIGGDLVNIELRVKGDPYWLEPNPHTLNTAPTSAFRRILTNRGVNPDQSGAAVQDGVREIDLHGIEHNDVITADTSAQQTLIVFRSFTPQLFNAETGLTPPGRRNVNSIAGIYAVKEVTHSFQGGEFTQTLHGNKDNLINIRDIDLDTDVDNILGGEYRPTVSEAFGANSNPSGFSLTPGENGSLIAVPSTATNTGNPGADFFGDLGLDLDSSSSGVINVSTDDISEADIMGNAPVGNTPPNDEGG